MLKNKNQLIVGAFLVSCVLSNSYGRLMAPATHPATGRDAVAEARRRQDPQIQDLLGVIVSVSVSRDPSRTEGLLSEMTAFVAGGADVNATDSCGQTLLHYALLPPAVNLRSVQRLIRLGARINQPDDGGSTALHSAVLYAIWHRSDGNGRDRNPENVVSVLIANKADPHRLDDNGRTPRQVVEAFLSGKLMIKTSSFGQVGDLSPEGRAALERMVRELKAAEKARLRMNPKAKQEDEIEFLGKEDIIRTRLALRRRKLEAAELPKQVKVQQLIIQDLEGALARIDAIKRSMAAAGEPMGAVEESAAVVAGPKAVAEEPVQKGWFERIRDNFRNFSIKNLLMCWGF
jgi:hypothetical protein